MENVEKKDRIGYIDIVKTIAIFAVVLLFTFQVSDDVLDLKDNPHIISMIMSNLATWAVPALVMCSGAVLLKKDHEVSVNKLFGKYIMRPLIAIFVFSFIFAVLDVVINKDKFSPEVIYSGFLDALTGNGWEHMWALYMLISLYFMLPFYKKIVNHSTNKEIIYLLALLAFFVSIIPMFETFFGSKTGFYINCATIYPFCFFLGYAIDSNIIKIDKFLAAVLALAGLIIMGIATWYCQSEENYKIGNALDEYYFPLALLAAFGIFSFFSSAKKRTAAPLLFESISKSSFGIYLLFMIAVKFLFSYFRFKPFKTLGLIEGFFLMILFACADFLVTWVVTVLIRKIPGIKKII